MNMHDINLVKTLYLISGKIKVHATYYYTVMQVNGNSQNNDTKTLI